ncbi:MAG: hypothetical protein CME64_08150 [Halobacteriovoraceae bacterium]|nr:hypothetical protein [Halobacteriovoraceae bacterium]
MKLIIMIGTLTFNSLVLAKNNHAAAEKVEVAEKVRLVEDEVYKLVEAEDSLEVLFRRHAARYVLFKGHKKYESIKKSLEDSKGPVKVYVNHDTLEVIKMANK